MSRILSVITVGFIMCTLVSGFDKKGTAFAKTRTTMKISVQANGKTIVFELNNSPAAKKLYIQLPLNIAVEDYSSNEKIFYPPSKLNTDDTPLAKAGEGTIAYYALWGDVVMFYSGFSPAPGLYELGHVISGSQYIEKMSGTIEIFT